MLVRLASSSHSCNRLEGEVGGKRLKNFLRGVQTSPQRFWSHRQVPVHTNSRQELPRKMWDGISGFRESNVNFKATRFSSPTLKWWFQNHFDDMWRTRRPQLAWCRTIQLWSPARHPLTRLSLHLLGCSVFFSSYSNVFFGLSGAPCHYKTARQEMLMLKCCLKARLVLTRGRWARNQCCRVLYEARWGRCALGGDVILPVTSRWIVKNDFKTIILRQKNDIVLL